MTKVRWVIEQVFGRFKKKFKIFAVPAHNATLQHDYEILLIAFAILNLFHEPILSDKEHEDISALMKSRLNVPNLLKAVVSHYNLSKLKVPYIDVSYTFLDNEEYNLVLEFPRLSLNGLYLTKLRTLFLIMLSMGKKISSSFRSLNRIHEVDSLL